MNYELWIMSYELGVRNENVKMKSAKSEWNNSDFKDELLTETEKLRLKTKLYEDKRLRVSRETPKYEAIKLFGTRWKSKGYCFKSCS